MCWYVEESLSVCFCANLILISPQRGSSGSLDQVGKKSEALGKKGLSRSLSVNDKYEHIRGESTVTLKIVQGSSETKGQCSREQNGGSEGV